MCGPHNYLWYGDWVNRHLMTLIGNQLSYSHKRKPSYLRYWDLSKTTQDHLSSQFIHFSVMTLLPHSIHPSHIGSKYVIYYSVIFQGLGMMCVIYLGGDITSFCCYDTFRLNHSLTFMWYHGGTDYTNIYSFISEVIMAEQC